MADTDDRKKFALGAAAVFVLLLACGVAWLWARDAARAGSAASTYAAPAPAPTASTGAAASVPVAAAEAASAAGGRLFIDAASGRLPPESIELLARVAEAARSSEGAMVEISGFYPPGGNAGASAGFAREHAEAVRHALEANGVSPKRMRVGAIEAAPGSDAREATRVELWVR